MKAYTKKMREKLSGEDGDMFGRWWENFTPDLRTATVEEIGRVSAGNIIMPYEWLDNMPAIITHSYGLFFDTPIGKVCGGAVVFGTEYGENLGHWDKYGFTGKIILLSRGACVHWCPKNSNSKLVMGAIKQLPEKYKIVTATIDSLAGETGTIYQACNFYYIGSMRASNPNVNHRPLDRFGVKIDGKLLGARAIRQKLGTQKKDVILAHYPDAEFVPQHSKGRYFLFRGSKLENKGYKKSIEHLIKPYPK